MLLCRKCEGSGRSGVVRSFPYFCEREGFYDGIPDGGVGNGWWVARSSALRPAAPDLYSTLTLHKMVADGCSSSKLRLGVVPGQRFVQLQQCIVSLVKIGIGVRFGLVLPALSLKLLLVVFKFVRIFSVKLVMYCAFY
jgi:hypothetical protein